MSDVVLDCLREARRLVARRFGWFQGADFELVGVTDDGYAYCALGALRHSAGYDVATEAIRLLSSVIRVPVTTIYAPDKVAMYNDTLGRRKSQVVAAFDRAIAKRKKQTE